LKNVSGRLDRRRFVHIALSRQALLTGKEEMHRTEGELVRKSLQGDTDAYAALVQRYQDAVYATAFYYAGRYGEAEDIAQEAFWKAYRNLHQLKDQEHFGAWLKVITTRTAADWLRRFAPRHEGYATPLPHRRAREAQAEEAAAPGVEADDYALVYRAIQKLPERYQLPVVLRYVQEMSYKEICRFTGSSYDEIRGILNRAGKLLRQELTAQQKQAEEGIIPWRRATK